MSEYVEGLAPASSELYERVQRGATLLDTFGPADWRSRVNPQTLEMLSKYGCVLAQVYGTDYDTALTKLGDSAGIELNQAAAVDHGFDCFLSDEQDGNPDLNVWDVLDLVWREYLSETAGDRG